MKLTYCTSSRFLPIPGKTEYVRVSYSCISNDKMDEALRRLAEVIREGAQEIANTNGH